MRMPWFSSFSASLNFLLLFCRTFQCVSVPAEVQGWYPDTSPVTGKSAFVSNQTFPEAGARSGYQFPRYDARLQIGDEVKLESIHNTWMTISNTAKYTLRGKTVVFKAASGMYCSVPRGHLDGGVRCDQSSPPFSAWLVIRGMGRAVTMQDLRTQKFCADDREKGVRCNRDEVSQWEVFDMVDVSGGRVAIQSGRSGLYCVDRGFSGLVCDSEEKFVGGATLFEPVVDVPLDPRIVHSTVQSQAATFVVERAQGGPGRLRFRCKDGDGYLSADKATGLLSCVKSESAVLLAARVTWWDGKAVTLRAPDSMLYLEAGDPNGDDLEVRAVNKEGNGWALWRVLVLGGFEVIRPLIRGVNLGNWLLLERWMAHELFKDESNKLEFIGDCPPVDEYGLMHALEKDVARRRMENHWETWITEADIEWLAKHGINSVRVPFGYWIVHPTPPFISGQLKHLDSLFRWCERHNIAVLLDFHGLKGSQTGNPTSGNCGGCGRKHCGKTTIDFLKEKTVNLDVISQLAQRYSSSPAYLGFEIANEVSSSVSSLDTMFFYQRAYEIIRKYSETALVLIFATFNPSTYPFHEFQSVAEDIHIYFGMGFGHPTTDQRKNLARATQAVQGLKWNVIVGEWTLGASGQRTENWGSDRRAEFFGQFARMQLQAWETTTIGWFYWNYKTAYTNWTWNFRDMCEGGWLPGCHSTLQYSPADWWRQPLCAYEYLDGGCPAPSLAIPILIGVVALALVISSGVFIAVSEAPFAASWRCRIGRALTATETTVLNLTSSMKTLCFKLQADMTDACLRMRARWRSQPVPSEKPLVEEAATGPQ